MGNMEVRCLVFDSRPSHLPSPFNSYVHFPSPPDPLTHPLTQHEASVDPKTPTRLPPPTIQLPKTRIASPSSDSDDVPGARDRLHVAAGKPGDGGYDNLARYVVEALPMLAAYAPCT